MGFEDLVFPTSLASFTLHFSNIVLGVRASGSPHVLSVWLGVSKVMIPVAYLSVWLGVSKVMIHVAYFRSVNSSFCISQMS